MSDDAQGGKPSINWGGLIKGIAAGAAIVVGVLLVYPGALGDLQGFFSGLIPKGDTSGQWLSDENMKTIGWVLKTGLGVALSATGITYFFSDGSKNENAERHGQQYHEAKESFAIREDMRKMQTVMMARMRAAGHEPAMALANQPAVG